MNELKIFESPEFGQVRAIEIEGNPWIVLSDVCKVLDLANPTMVANRLDEDERSKFNLGRQGEAIVINESGLYATVLRSDKPNARKFRKWVTSEVLPSIRKTGTYKKSLTNEEIMRIQLTMIDDVSVRVDKLENTMVIDYGQQRVLERLVNANVVTALGGKDSTAYKEIGKKVFAECNRDIKDYFDVNSRNNIPRVKFDDACRYIKNWQPCTNTKMLIDNCNSQYAFN